MHAYCTHTLPFSMWARKVFTVSFYLVFLWIFGFTSTCISLSSVGKGLFNPVYAQAPVPSSSKKRTSKPSSSKTQGSSSANPAHQMDLQTSSETGPYALFWSRGHTFIADVGAGRLYQAPTLYSQGPGGILFEYRLTSHSKRLNDSQARSSSKNPFGWMYRWTQLERHLIGGQQYDVLTNHFEPQQLEGDFNDEHRILMFNGQWVTLGRWVEQRQGQKHLRSTSAYTLDLNQMKLLPLPPASEHLVELIRSYFPTLIHSCYRPSSFAVRWQLPLQTHTQWLLLTPRPQVYPCPSSLSALRFEPLSPSQHDKSQKKQHLSWKENALFSADRRIFSNVADVLIHPEHQHALILEGAPRDHESQLFIEDVTRLVEPEVRRFLTLWDRKKEREVSFFDQINLHRIDGAHWISPQHSLLTLLPTHFQEVGLQNCIPPLMSYRTKAHVQRTRPPTPTHLCQIEAQGRIWEGVNDLSAAVDVSQTNRTLFIDLWVQDDQVTQGDQVQVWFGDPESPSTLVFQGSSIFGKDHLRDQTLSKWNTVSKRNRKSSKSGYTLSIELPLKVVNTHLALSIQDQDRHSRGGKLTLWQIGQRPQFGDAVVPNLFLYNLGDKLCGK